MKFTPPASITGFLSIGDTVAITVADRIGGLYWNVQGVSPSESKGLNQLARIAERREDGRKMSLPVQSFRLSEVAEAGMDLDGFGAGRERSGTLPVNAICECFAVDSPQTGFPGARLRR
ncbi:MAG: hypothetical protein ABSB35_35905 [Bryobacteraceae bacterium]